MAKTTKFGLSALILLIAVVLTLWPGSPLRADLAVYVAPLAVGMIAMIWVFPTVSL